MSADIPAFGEALASYRTRTGLSQQQLASALGMGRRAIAAWEGGEYLPKAKGVVLQIARILKLNDEEATTLLKAAGIDPSPAIWNIPYPRNPFFTGRDQELEHLHVQLQQGTTAAVSQAQSISGLGGIGKTQLAVEYVYRHQDEYQYLLWAGAESVEALTASFTEIADRLNLPEKDAQEQAITIEAVKGWLQRHRGWLLILDNTDSPALLPDFLPPTVRGHLLITTRAAEVSTHLAGLAHPLVVDSFSDEQGARFLLHRAGLLERSASFDQAETYIRQLALAIAHELGGLPLALDQAGAYLKVTGSSLAAYQHLYQQHRAQMLAQRRGANHPEPVATTWNISFRNVEQHNPAAADLLRLCAFLAPDAIPEEILTKGAKVLGPVLAPLATDDYLLNEAIESLRAYSLITRNSHTQTLTIHRLVQEVLKDAMERQTYKEWAERTVKSTYASLPKETNFATWSQWERYRPHAVNCAALAIQLTMTALEAVDLTMNTGEYLMERAQYRESEQFLRYAMFTNAEQRGKTDGRTNWCIYKLVELYVQQGEYEQAERLGNLLAIYEKYMDPENPVKATFLHTLASLYLGQGKYIEAEQLYQRAITINEQIFGENDLAITASLQNLAELYRRQEKYEQTELLLQRALTICQQQLGSKHPTMANILNNLGMLYELQGKYEQAKPLLLRALKISMQELGEHHPKVAACLNNLALLYEMQGEYEQAKWLYLGALISTMDVFGENHLKFVHALHNLAELYRKQEKYMEAEPLLRDAVVICERLLGPEHPTAASIYNTLASLYYHQGKYQLAEPLLQRALAIREQGLGPDHPDTASSLNNLSILYDAQGRHSEAEPLHQRALQIRTAVKRQPS